MKRRASLRTILLIAGGSLLWFLLMAGVVVGIGMGPAHAQPGWPVSVGTEVTASPRATLTVAPTTRPTQQTGHRGQAPTKSGKPPPPPPPPSWIPLVLVLIGCAVLVVLLGFLLWGRTHPDRYRELREKAEGLLPWHQRGQPAGWTLEVAAGLLTALSLAAGLVAQVLAGTVTTAAGYALIVAVVLILAAAVVTLRSTQLKNERRWQQEVRENKRRWDEQVGGLLKKPLGKDDKLPLLSTLDPYGLGVSSSPYGSEGQRGRDPYVPRTITDKELDRALASERFVLVVGDSKAGKSRTAYEAAKRLSKGGQPHDPRVLVVNSTSGLGAVLNLDPPLDLHPEPALLWLDDLSANELLGLTQTLLDRLIEHMIVLGTMTARTYGEVWDSDSDIIRPAHGALDRAKFIPLDALLDPDERADAEGKYPEQFEAGIGEQLVAGKQLSRRHDVARLDTYHHHGWAVVQAAIDWTRMDVGRPITQHELISLCPLYLEQRRGRSGHDGEEHEDALQRACKPVVTHIALLTEVPADRGERAYEVFEYLVAAANGQDGRDPTPILDAAWDGAMAFVSPREAFRAGVSAYLRQLPGRAYQFFKFAAESPEGVPVAAVSLAELLKEQGKIEEAKAAYWLAINSGHAEWAPQAAIRLAMLLEARGEIEDAKAAYWLASVSAHAEAAPAAAFGLGQLLAKQGKTEEAKAAYRLAINSGHARWAPGAAVLLGVLLQQQGEIEEAKAALQQAIDSGHPEWAPRAAVMLGALLELQDRIEEAKHAYQWAIDSGHPEWASRAAEGLRRIAGGTAPPTASGTTE